MNRTSNEQASDMLSFRKIGEQGFEENVKYQVLQHSATIKATLQQHKLLIMLTKKLKVLLRREITRNLLHVYGAT